MESTVRSKQLSLGHYDTDKIANGYLEWYDPILQPLVSRDVKVLEIGVRAGGSLLLWRDYFPKGTIVGVDVQLPEGLSGEDRIQVFRGNQEDTAFLSEVALKTAPEGFDLIIDDASHIGVLTKVAFWHLFDNHLKHSGLYVIEDWGTGYWDDWPDGRSFQPESPWRPLGLRLLQKLNLARKPPWANHNYGMVGFVKELVDEQGAADLTRAHLSGVPVRPSKFDKMVITPSIVFITKSTQGGTVEKSSIHVRDVDRP
jgi:hypothetical protein